MSSVLLSDPIPLTMGGYQSFAGRIFDGKYTDIDPYVTSSNFPITMGQEFVDKVRLLFFSRNPLTEEVLEEFSNYNLIPPTPEHAIAFGAQYDELCVRSVFKRGGPIIFLHEPWVSPRGNKGVLYLCGWNDTQTLPPLKALKLEWVNLPHAPVKKPDPDIPLSDELGYGWRNSVNRWQACWGCRFLGVER